MKTSLIGFATGLFSSFYLTYHSFLKNNNLIFGGLFHIHHWMWGCILAFLLYNSLLKDKGLYWQSRFRCYSSRTILIVGLLHLIQLHLVPAAAFVLVYYCVVSIYEYTRDEKTKDWTSKLLLGITIGLVTEGILSGIVEVIFLGNWSAFNFFVK